MLVLAVLGIALVAALSASAPAKGLVGGAIGLFLATVGLDPSDGVPRFTFGQLFLWDGVGLLPTALGLFAVPEAVALLQTPTSARTHAVAGHAWSGMREVWQHRRLVLRCSLIGTIIGVLPGIGATVSQWLAYAHAAQQSPRRLHFGTGEIEGVIGPGAASNATLGGDLVPTLALGIPGSLPTAILLGALVLEGLTPGPAMLLPEREGGHLALVFSFVWMVAIGNVAAAAISLAGLRQLTALTTIRPLLLFPLVMALVPVGAYAERHAAGDLALVAIMGLAGCVMARYDWPRAPVLLGLVFGPMLERRSLLTLEAYDATWVLRPGVLLLGAGAALVIWGSRRVARTVEPTVRPGAEWGDVVLSSLIAAFALAALLWTGTLSGAPAIVPRVTLGLTSTAAALIAVTTWRRLTHAATRVPPGRLPVHDLAWMMAFLAAPLVGGFVPAAALGTAAFLRTAARVSWARTLLVTAGISGVVAALQVYGLQGSRPGWW